jgi:hypothetical protein
VAFSVGQGRGRSPAFSLWAEERLEIPPAGEWHVRKRKGGMRTLGADSAVGRSRRTLGKEFRLDCVEFSHSISKVYHNNPIKLFKKY